MENNSAKIKHKCLLCKYETFRKFDLKRHQINKHPIYEETQINVNPNITNVNPNVTNVNPNIKNVNSDIFMCKKCNKI